VNQKDIQKKTRRSVIAEEQRALNTIQKYCCKC